MKALSMWQPWASLYGCTNIKLHETRGWETSHRGWLLIHAAQKIVHDHDSVRLNNILDSEFGGHWGMDLPRGAIIGAVNLIVCKRTDDIFAGLGDLTEAQEDDVACGNFEDGRFGWLKSEFKKFATPIPFRGRQRIFNVPDDLVREAMAA